MTMHAITALLLLFATDDGSPEWGSFRGNNGQGLATNASIPSEVGSEATQAWRVEVPAGYSSPVVSGEHVFLTGVEESKLLTLCLQRTDGKELWRKEIEFDGLRVGMNSSAAPTPVTDGERVYVLFHSRGLVAYDVEGKELWKHQIGPFNIPHGMSTSPIVHDDLVLLVVDQDLDSYVVAYDKESGEERWKTKRPGVTHSYSTPAVYTPEEGPAQLIVSGSLQVTGYSLEDGKRLWWVDGSAWQTKAVPIIVGDECFVSAYMVPSTEFGMPKLQESWEAELEERDANGDEVIGRDEWEGQMIQMVWFIFDLNGDEVLDKTDWEYMGSAGTATGGLFAINLGGTGNVTETHVKWKFDDRRGLPDCPTPLCLDDTLYLIKEGGLLTAIDPESGEVSKQDRVGEPDAYFASPIGAGDRLLTASRGGQLAVIQAGREWEVLSVHDLKEELWSTPALADGQVFVRTQEALWCFEESADG